MSKKCKLMPIQLAHLNKGRVAAEAYYWKKKRVSPWRGVN